MMATLKCIAPAANSRVARVSLARARPAALRVALAPIRRGYGIPLPRRAPAANSLCVAAAMPVRLVAAVAMEGHTELEVFLRKIHAGSPVEFQDTMDAIATAYDFHPVAFSVGDGKKGGVESAAGENQGSCKIFAFAKLHDLDEDKTLACFGKFYTEEVLGDPAGTGHGNIRAFISGGWPHVSMEEMPLKGRE